MTKDECDERAKENRRLAEQALREGKKEMASDAYQRAFEWERRSDSWLYRTFGL